MFWTFWCPRWSFPFTSCVNTYCIFVYHFLGCLSNIVIYVTFSIQHDSPSVSLFQTGKMGQHLHFREFQHTVPTPWGSCKSSHQHIVIPLSLFLVGDIFFAATFSLSLLFACVWHILVVHFLYMPSPPAAAAPLSQSGWLNWCLPAVELVSQS